MKKIVLLLAFSLSIGNVFAQDADKLRDAGDAALKAKNYVEAFTNYDGFLKQTNNEDADRVFNCAFAAFQAKKYEEAAKYYDLAIKKNKNTDDAYAGKAMSLRNLNKTKEFTTTIAEGLKAKPGDANLEKLLYVYCVKQGQTAQKAGNVAKAEEMFKEVLTVSNAKYKENALYSLGAMYYNEGAKVLSAAASDAAKYEEAKTKATPMMNKAKEYMEQAIALNKENANAKKILDSIKETLAK